MGWVLPAITLGSALFGAFSGHKSKSKQAEAEKEAQERKYAAQKAFWDSQESHRGFGMDAARALLGSGNSALPGINYRIPDAAFNGLKAPRPFAGSLPADPKAGLGWSLLGGLAGGVGQAGYSGMLGQLVGGSGGGESPWYSSMVPWQSNDDRTRICALAPNLPGCPKPTPLEHIQNSALGGDEGGGY